MKTEFLDEKLIAYSRSDVYPFHMPGHKRQSMGTWIPEEIDITEIDGFDNLHHAEDILKEAQERMAKVFGAERSYFLVNGSSCGLLAAISAVTKKGDSILVARNSHKAVYHGIYQMELNAVYLYPDTTEWKVQGSISPGQVKDALSDHPECKAILITSPTYDGVVSDIGAIADIAHAAGIPLIVDEAHGAHFGFSGGFPKKALAYGADLVVESLHKTLPSYTQTAVLHVQGERVDRTRLERFLGIYQSSSPSYVFMAGMDRCTRIMWNSGPDVMLQFEKRLQRFYEATKENQVVQIMPSGPMSGIVDRDASKILISARRAGLSGQELQEILLERYHLQMEMAAGHYVTALTSFMDTQEGFDRLLKAILELEETLPVVETDEPELTPLELYQPREKRMAIHEAMEAEQEPVKRGDLAGKTAGEFVYLYPPGIPLIVPGEVWTGELIALVDACMNKSMQVQGMADHTGTSFLTVKVPIVLQ